MTKVIDLKPILRNFCLLTIGVFLFIALNISKSYAGQTIATIEYTPGIDSGTDTLLPTSDWTLEVTTTYEMVCSDISADLSFYKTKLVPVKSYIDRALDCNTATHPGFESETYISWEDDGFYQAPEFGTESITCPIYGQCEMDRVVNTERRYFDTITLANGENGTFNGAGKIFVTRLNNATIQSLPGTGGVGGLNDLNAVTSQERYCVKIQDAVTADATPTSSKTPYASVNVYDWLPFEITPGGANGVDASTGNKIEIYEGLDPSVLYHLKSEYMN